MIDDDDDNDDFDGGDDDDNVEVLTVVCRIAACHSIKITARDQIWCSLCCIFTYERAAGRVVHWQSYEHGRVSLVRRHEVVREQRDERGRSGR